MKATGPEAGASLLSDKAPGREIATFQVFGINSLKTLVTPEVLTGLRAATATVRDGKIMIDLESHALQVDLQRTGAVVWTDSGTPADLEPRPSTVTGKLTFADGSSASFVEPAKTKRIAFWITQVE